VTDLATLESALKAFGATAVLPEEEPVLTGPALTGDSTEELVLTAELLSGPGLTKEPAGTGEEPVLSGWGLT